MTTPMYSVFIGSSTEGSDVAKAIEVELQPIADTTVWMNGVFQLGSGTLESLMEALGKFDFAIMVLTPDDLLESRANQYSSPRDNVLFELGLFMGRLGRKRAFIVNEEAADLKLPSDLAGIARATYRRRENLRSAVSSACTLISEAMKSLGPLAGREGVEPSFTGQWEELDSGTRYVLRLNQDGVKVTGTYNWKGGEVTGQVEDDGSLQLKWKQDNGISGGGVLSLASNGQRLDGYWWYSSGPDRSDNSHMPWHFRAL